jgi:23S rRNA (pseudouridine1915-N3)-methyltransferase
MRLTLLCVGKKHDPLLVAAIDDYSRRLSHYYPVAWDIVPPGQGDMAAVRTVEAKALLAKLKPDDYVILLDERGRQFDSPGLARQLEQQALSGRRSLVFVIGGAHGVSLAMTERANLIWSLSALVFPHQLVRLILAEQLYRAATISKGEHYHHA